MNRKIQICAFLGMILSKSLFAEETHSVLTSLHTTTLNGYVDTSGLWWAGFPARQTIIFSNPTEELIAHQFVQRFPLNNGIVFDVPTMHGPGALDNSAMNVQVVPEPAPMALALAGLAAAFMMMKRKRLSRIG